MELKTLFSYITDYGFPMILSWYLLVRIEGKLTRLSEVIGELSTRIAGLPLKAA